MNTINIKDMDLEGKELVVTFSATYHLPISWLANEKGDVGVNPKNKANLAQLVVEYFSGQMFSDAFGRIPAEYYSIGALHKCDDIQKEINKRISLAIAEQKKKESEEKKRQAEMLEEKKKNRIAELKKELAELEKNVG